MTSANHIVRRLFKTGPMVLTVAGDGCANKIGKTWKSVIHLTWKAFRDGL
jgi:hypothetical protein